MGAAHYYLDQAKEAARTDDAEGRALAVVKLGAEVYQVAPHGAKGGVRWILRNPDMTVTIRGSSRWPITVRYSAAGLWQHGLLALRDRTYHMLRAGFHANDDTEPMLGQCHYAFDFYCPAFTEEMKFSSIVDQVVCHPGTKRKSDGVVPVSTHGNAARLETLTIGTKAGLQVQVYDKTTELKEVPGKEWMRAVYAGNGFEFSEDEWADVWRLEPRFGGAWLKERNIRHTAELLRFFPELITEAIFSRRLTVRTKDSNRGRWPLHPLWTAAYQARGAPAMRPVGFHPTERKSKLLRSMLLNVVGGIRSLAVLQDGKFDGATVNDVLSQIYETMISDPEHEAKVKKLLERYRFVDHMG